MGELLKDLSQHPVSHGLNLSICQTLGVSRQIIEGIAMYFTPLRNISAIDDHYRTPRFRLEFCRRRNLSMIQDCWLFELRRRDQQRRLIACLRTNAETGELTGPVVCRKARNRCVRPVKLIRFTACDRKIVRTAERLITSEMRSTHNSDHD